MGGGCDTRRLYCLTYYPGSYGAIDNTKCQWYSGDCINKATYAYSVKRGIDNGGVLCRIGDSVYVPYLSKTPFTPTMDDAIFIEDEDIGMGIYDYLPECWVMHLINVAGFNYLGGHRLWVINHNTLVSDGFQRD